MSDFPPISGTDSITMHAMQFSHCCGQWQRSPPPPPLMLLMTPLLALLLVSSSSAVPQRTRSLDESWRFVRADEPAAAACSGASFPHDLGQLHCAGLIKIADASVHLPQTPTSCAASCCRLGDSCDTYSFCPPNGSCSSVDTGIPGVGMEGCWVGLRINATATLDGEEPGSVGCNATTAGWITRGRPAAAICTRPDRFCASGFDDSEWRSIDLPHDWSSKLTSNPSCWALTFVFIYTAITHRKSLK